MAPQLHFLWALTMAPQLHFLWACYLLWQVMGFAAASKRQRGIMQKMAYSEEGLMKPPR